MSEPDDSIQNRCMIQKRYDCQNESEAPRKLSPGEAFYLSVYPVDYFRFRHNFPVSYNKYPICNHGGLNLFECEARK